MLKWSEIRGQERAKSILERALDSGRVHHAYLFTGLQGVGKALTAHTFAGVVNCLERPEGTFADVCGQCSSCRKIAQRQHPDIIFVEPQGQFIKIQQVREIQKSCATRPYEARFRVVLIDDAHTMNDQAANALLKTLEEPSERMQLILVTDQPHRLLDTIISRCQILRFGALDQETVVHRLSSLLHEEGFEPMPGPDGLAVAAGYGEGSLGRSLAIVRSGMLEERRDFITRVSSLKIGEPRMVLDLAEAVAKNKDDLDSQLDVLKLFFRDIMLLKASGDDHRVINRDVTDLVEDGSQRYDMNGVLGSIERICRAQDLLTRNVNPQLIVEDLFRHISELSA